METLDMTDERKILLILAGLAAVLFVVFLLAFGFYTEASALLGK